MQFYMLYILNTQGIEIIIKEKYTLACEMIKNLERKCMNNEVNPKIKCMNLAHRA